MASSSMTLIKRLGQLLPDNYWYHCRTTETNDRKWEFIPITCPPGNRNIDRKYSMLYVVPFFLPKTTHGMYLRYNIRHIFDPCIDYVIRPHDFE